MDAREDIDTQVALASWAVFQGCVFILFFFYLLLKGDHLLLVGSGTFWTIVCSIVAIIVTLAQVGNESILFFSILYCNLPDKSSSLTVTNCKLYFLTHISS